MKLLPEMIAFAKHESPNEACGLVVQSGRRSRLLRAKNIDERPRVGFTIDPDAWLEVGDDETVVGIFHSHPLTSPEPSPADLTSCELSGLPWHIVTPDGGYTYTEPSGYQAPLEGRPYVYGVHDCYTIVRDWYQRTWGITLKEFDRPVDWWLRGGNMFVEGFTDTGFYRVVETPLAVGDLVLIQYAAPVPNHIAVYLGDDLILHHVEGRLSTKDYYRGMWSRHTTHQLRHRDRPEAAHG